MDQINDLLTSASFSVTTTILKEMCHTYNIKYTNKKMAATEIYEYLLPIVCSEFDIETQSGFLQLIDIVNKLYFNEKTQSNKSIGFFQIVMKFYLDRYMIEHHLPFTVHLEKNVTSYHWSGIKRGDIVILDGESVVMYIPIKFPRVNINQNKHNLCEALAGESLLIKSKHPECIVFPIYMNYDSVPYLSNGVIRTFEDYESIVDPFLNSPFCPYVKGLRFVFHVQHQNLIGEKFTKVEMLSFHNNTPFEKPIETMGILFNAFNNQANSF